VLKGIADKALVELHANSPAGFDQE